MVCTRSSLCRLPVSLSGHQDLKAGSLGESRFVCSFYILRAHLHFFSFICSSNNNILRITKMVQALCNHYSAPLLSLSDQSQTYSYHPFPPPSALAAPGVTATLRSLGFGYRADFIHRTAKMLVDTHGVSRLLDDPREASEKWLMTLRSKSVTEAREELLKFVGVGRKVADCVLLMSLDKVNFIICIISRR